MKWLRAIMLLWAVRHPRNLYRRPPTAAEITACGSSFSRSLIRSLERDA